MNDSNFIIELEHDLWKVSDKAGVPGTMIFEIDGIKEEAARGALERATDKLSLKTKFIKRSRQ